MARGRAVAAAVLWGLAATHLVEAAVLRRRVRRLEPLPPAPPDERGVAEAVVVTAADGAVDAATRRAAARLLAGDTALVDLVPARLPSARALRLVRRIDPARLRTDALHTPSGAHEALVVRADVAAGMAAGGPDPGPVTPVHDRGDLVRRTVTAQRHAASAALGRGRDVRVAPDLSPAPFTARDRWRELVELTAYAGEGDTPPGALVAAETAHLLALTAGLAVAPAAAVAATVTWSAQPALVFAGRRGRAALAPPHLVRDGVIRVARAWADNVATVGAALRERRIAAAAPPRSADAAPAADLFDAAHTACPWCGDDALMPRLDTTDLIQHKPGRFHLDECDRCRHVFQNPPLSLAGLDHYYDQFYDGEGEELWEFTFAAMGPAYTRRLDVLDRFTTPRSWLDVGTGHGHMCLVGRQRWPGVKVAGVDISASVDEALRRGWIDDAHRGLLPELAAGMAGAYDLVTMFHYLEHTRDPRSELAAAATVLEPGGHLMIEGPDVECPWAGWLGRYWRCWFQPQHQHFVTCANLVGALGEAGFDVVSVERGPATEGFDVTSAVMFWINAVAPGPTGPWGPPPTAASQARRIALLAAAAPVLVATAAVDAVKDVRLRRPGTVRPGNAYRLVARRR